MFGPVEAEVQQLMPGRQRQNIPAQNGTPKCSLPDRFYRELEWQVTAQERPMQIDRGPSRLVTEEQFPMLALPNCRVRIRVGGRSQKVAFTKQQVASLQQMLRPDH